MEFAGKQQAFDTGWRFLLFFLPYIGGMILFAIPAKHLDDNPHLAWIWFPAFFGYLVIFPWVWMRFAIPKEQKRFLKRPACKKPPHLSIVL